MRFAEPPPKKPLDEILESVDHDTVDLLRECSMAVRFEDWQDRVSLADFRNMKRLALAEMWGRDDVDFAAALKMPQEQIEAWQKIPEFLQIKEALVTSFQELRDPKTFEDHIKDVKTQDRFARRLKLDGASVRTREKLATRAQEVFAERAMPVQHGAPGEQRPVIYIQQTQIDRMANVQTKLLDAGVDLGEENVKLISVSSPAEVHGGVPGSGEKEGA